MDPLIAQLFGILGGALAGLLAVIARGGSQTRQPTRIVGRSAKQRVRERRAVKRVSTRPSALRNGRVENKTPPVQPSRAETSVSSAHPSPSFSACPSCGLEAPYELMEEHFGGSPSHEKARALEETEQTVPETKPGKANSNDDTKRALRNLLQMLVPPRAFGRRHSQMTENPLSRIVHELGNARTTPVPPIDPETERAKVYPEILFRNPKPDTS